MTSYRIAVVGATGAVGQEILRTLERRNFPVKSLKPLASARSAGKTVQFEGRAVPVEELRAEALTMRFSAPGRPAHANSPKPARRRARS
jgi:aspartate-semialdehyde dehydrogenase